MDAAGHVLFRAADLVLRAEAATSADPTTTTGGPTSTVSGTATASPTSTGTAKAERPGFYKIVGLLLAICSGLFIGVSFVLKKVGLLRANVKYNEEAGEGYGYLVSRRRVAPRKGENWLTVVTEKLDVVVWNDPYDLGRK